MPAKPAHEPEPDATPATAKPTDTAPAPTAPEAPEGRLPGGVYEFTYPIATQYLDVPLTARPADPGRAAEGDDPGVRPTPATVFHWQVSAPDDGRWQPTKRKPNQVADNAAPLTSEE